MRAASGKELPDLVSHVFEYFQITDSDHIILLLGAACFIAVLLSGVIRAFGNSFIISFNHNFRNIITEKVLKSFLFSDYLTSLQHNRQEIESSLFTDTDMLISTVFTPLTNLLNSSVVLLFTLSFLIYLDLEATIIALSFFGLVYFIIVKIAFRFLRKFSRRREESNLKRYEYVNSILTLYKHIKINNNQRFYLEQAVTSTNVFSKSISNSQQLSIVPKFLIESLGFGVILAYMLSQMNAGGDLAKVAVFAFAGYRMMPLIQNVYAGITQMKYGLPLLGKFTKFVITFESDLIDKKPKEGLEQINLENVTFSYSKKHNPVVSEVNLRIEKGDSIGIVGATGSGKSTLIDILAGLLTPTNGVISYIFDDKSKSYAQNECLKIAYVDQNVLLENKSIRDNIVDHEELNEDKIFKIAKSLDLDSDLEVGSPLELNKVILRNGENLSGGQKQRISILRALYKEPEILILDEATSALDNSTQKKIVDGIHELKNIKFILSIAHRIEALTHCNKIFQVADGKLIEVNNV
jgi:ABC-type multidrug transport system fused ATPase/permease subunit